MSTGEMVTAICPTYGRYPDYGHLLNECVYWFTQQTYPNKELLILNDCAYQRLNCSVPGVRIVNTADRRPTLGAKYNLMLAMAKGKYIMPWEDDDISLPNRMDTAVRRFEIFKNMEYYNPQASWYEENGKLIWDHRHGVCHNTSCYTADFADRIGGYGEGDSGNQDATFDAKAKQLGTCFGMVESMPDWSYVYRWGVSDIHLSGTANYRQSYLDNRRGKPGVYEVLPVMRKNYAANCLSVIDGIRSGVVGAAGERAKRCF